MRYQAAGPTQAKTLAEIPKLNTEATPFIPVAAQQNFNASANLMQPVFFEGDYSMQQYYQQNSPGNSYYGDEGLQSAYSDEQDFSSGLSVYPNPGFTRF